MRASDSERERVAERLREAVAEGRLTMEEFEERLEAALGARTHSDLEPLVRDLPAPGVAPGLPGLVDPPGTPGAPVAPGGSIAPGAPVAGVGWEGRFGGRVTSRMAFAFWGGFGRRGTWTVPRRFLALTVMAGGELDLREALFEEREVVIRCFTLMGGMNVIVTPDTTVEVTGVGFLGGFGESGTDPAPDPAAPRVRITGFALMGAVGVIRKRSKAEKQRLKAEREQARLAARREREALEAGSGPDPDREPERKNKPKPRPKPRQEHKRNSGPALPDAGDLSQGSD
ncbi:DUF1707 domain-containing protein [Streptomyces sp. NPDC000594]|uniref:DUF1707 SHOCT-like domain-containing protein n=1 Tax=Streptomyces sp. NPDC000594 TaxID=3154261 RepID=UPI00332CF44A